MRRALQILIVAEAFFLLAGGMFGPIYAVFVERIGGDLLTAGTAYATFAIVAGVLIVLISRWEDRFKHQEKFIILGYALSCIGFLGYLLIQSPIHLFMVQVIFGLGEAVNSPAWSSVYSKSLDKGKFASEWGLYSAMKYIIIAVAATFGGFLANIYGFQFIFKIMLMISIAGLIISAFLVLKKCRR